MFVVVAGLRGSSLRERSAPRASRPELAAVALAGKYLSTYSGGAIFALGVFDRRQRGGRMH